MHRPTDFPPSPSFLSLLLEIEEEQSKLPQPLRDEIHALKNALRQALLDEEPFLLEPMLEALLPKTWGVRMLALPILAELDLTAAFEKVERDFSLIHLRLPHHAAEAAEKLAFGLHLMTDFVKKTIESNPESLQNLGEATYPAAPQSPPTYAQLSQALATENRAMFQLLHGSLTMELLFLSLDLVADEQLPIEFGMTHELNYLAAVCVKEYAGAFGLDDTQMPWYHAPQNDFQRLLLSAPVATAEQIQFIQEKRAHFNTWQ